MAIVTCPECQARLHVDGSLRGAVACSKCGAAIYIALPVAEPVRQHVDEFQDLPHYPRQRASQRRRGFPWANLFIQFAIASTTIFGAYKLFERLNPEPPKPVAKKRIVVPRAPVWRPLRQPEPKIAPVASVPAPVPDEPPPRPSPPLTGLPRMVELPARDVRDVMSMADAPAGVTLALLANSQNLTLDGAKVQFAEGDAAAATIAGLRINNGHVEFRWADVTDEAERALRNSVVVLTSGDDHHAIALRQPVRVKAGKMGLKLPVLRLASKCDWHPDAEAIRFTLTSHAMLPAFIKDGDDVEGMVVGQKTLLKYRGQIDAATEVRIRRSGKVVMAEFESRYVLPSGDVEVLTVARGNEKINELERLLSDAQAAPDRLYGFRMQADNLRISIQRSVANGVPAQAEARTLANVENQMAGLVDLISQEQGIGSDLRNLRDVAELAAALRQSVVAYRFYELVGDVEVDLIIAE